MLPNAKIKKLKKDCQIKIDSYVNIGLKSININLLIGSAPESVDWVNTNIDLLRSKCVVCYAINNATVLLSNNKINHIWLHSADFYQFRKTRYDIKKEFILKEIIIEYKNLEPYKVKSRKRCTTVLIDSICYIYNHSNAKIAIAGSNFVYSGINTHFYGKGDPDPLRCGSGYLSKQLNKLNDEIGHNIFNVNPIFGTLLPFKHINLLDLYQSCINGLASIDTENS